MLFKRSYQLKTQQSIESLQKSLIGTSIPVHDLTFEVVNTNNNIKIVPHAEHDEKLRILPITRINLQQNGNETNVLLTSKPRKIDVGGPNLLMIFCLFLIVCGLFLFTKSDMMLGGGIMIGLGILVFIIFWINLQKGYFDYVKKLKKSIQSKL